MVNYDVYQMSCARFSLTTEMDSSLVLNFAFPCGLCNYDFDLNEAIDVYDFIP